MIDKSLTVKCFFSLLLVSLLSFQSGFAQDNLDEGKELFKINCAQCHNKNMKDNLTGPALGGFEVRWEGREELLYEWIRNSQAVIASGDKYANDLYNEWNKTLMNPFPNLTDEQIDNILAYIDGVYTGTYGPTLADGTGGDAAAAEKADYTLLYVVLFIILALLAIILARVVSNLQHIALAREGHDPGPRKTLMETLTSRGVIGFLLFAVVVLGGYTTVNNAIDFGRQQGYAPEQPIKFSHVTHAEIHQIDCQYCHDGARRSKHSIIPAANTCMNCHRAITKGSEYGTAELTKIYASIGFNPNTNTYVDDYDNISEDSIAAIYQKWIADNYKSDNSVEALDAEGERVVAEQWDGIVSSLTNDQKKKIQGPIEWVRVHNLPDHVYFNHAQHVDVGEIECEFCHGPVQEMEVLQQYAPLSMGWCVNCHRETEVQFVGNDYYESYKKYHKELAGGKREKVTVEDIGGLECQKCHY